MDLAQFNQFMKIQQEMMAALVNQQQETIATQKALAAAQLKETPARSENTVLLPNFENFDTKKESFRNYKLRFENYVQMKGINNNQEYCAKLLLNSIGAKNFNMIAALAAPTLPGELDYKNLMQILERHLSPKKNCLVAQHQFLSKYQEENQSIAEFVALLRTDIGDCEFFCSCNASVADILLRAQFIRGLRDNSIREKILQSETTGFSDIVDKAVALEASKLDSRELSQKFSTPSTSTPFTSTDINKIDKKKFGNEHREKKSQNHHFQNHQFQKKKPQQKSRIDLAALGLDGTCLRCGRHNHLVTDCRTDLKNLKCSSCNKKGHVEKVCIRTLLEKKKKNQQSTHQITTTPEPRNYSTFHIEDVLQNQHLSKDNERFTATVKIEGNPITFEVDSGSGYTFLPQNQFEKLNLKVPLLPASMEFRSYTRDLFVPHGKIKVNVEFNGATT